MTSVQVFSCEYYEIFKLTLFIEPFYIAASGFVSYSFLPWHFQMLMVFLKSFIVGGFKMALCLMPCFSFEHKKNVFCIATSCHVRVYHFSNISLNQYLHFDCPCIHQKIKYFLVFSGESKGNIEKKAFNWLFWTKAAI